jgi:hypothetical protein
MKPRDAIYSLTVLRDRFNRILDPTAARVLDQAIAQAKASAGETPEEGTNKHRKKKKKKVEPPWGFQITPDSPLQFQKCAVKETNVRVDLFCHFEWPSDSTAEASVQKLAVRVWALDRNLCYRADWDAERVRGEVNESFGRVMLRFHFDLAEPLQSGPRHHLQIGGVPHAGELWSLPPSLNLPRIAHPPTDLVLACEMIAANFFPLEYRQIQAEATWKKVVRISQAQTLREYHALCHGVVSVDEPPKNLLDALWNG